jgi:hypothetical protein
LVRSAEQASALQQLGIAARVGTLDDARRKPSSTPSSTPPAATTPARSLL